MKLISYSNKKDAERIINGIEKHDIRQLEGNYCEFKRLRVGNYRIIFDNENNIMYIYEINHRKDAYND